MAGERSTAGRPGKENNSELCLSLNSTGLYSHGVCVTLQYRLAEMKGMHKMRLSPISAYRKKATAVHWRVMVISWRETDT